MKLPKSKTLDHEFLKDTQYPPEVRDFYKPPPTDWYAIIMTTLLIIAISVAIGLFIWLI